MKTSVALLLVMLVMPLYVLTGCASQTKSSPHPPDAASAEAPAQAREDSPQADDSESALSSEEENLLDDDWASTEDLEPQEAYQVADPIEPFNRVMFQFNDKLYEWVLRPLSLGYRKVTPRKMRIGVNNFFANLTAPLRSVNCILQGKGRAAGTEVGKFVVNSTLGLLGFIDYFKDYPELYPDPEDLGQSLAVYGIGDGFYLVLPFFNSSTLRDAIGMVGDRYMDPVYYVEPVEAAMAVKGYRNLNLISFHIEDIDAAKKAALDPYEAARNFYIQSRQNKIKK